MQGCELEYKTYNHTFTTPAREIFFRTLLYFLPRIRSESTHSSFHVNYKFCYAKIIIIINNIIIYWNWVVTLWQ